MSRGFFEGLHGNPLLKLMIFIELNQITVWSAVNAAEPIHLTQLI